jgi:hypothetical protein
MRLQARYTNGTSPQASSYEATTDHARHRHAARDGGVDGSRRSRCASGGRRRDLGRVPCALRTDASKHQAR